MAEGNGLEVSVGPVRMEATGDRSLQAAMFIVMVGIVVGTSVVTWNGQDKIRESVNRLTIATLTSDDDKKSAIGGNLREELKEELKKTAVQAVKKSRGD